MRVLSVATEPPLNPDNATKLRSWHLLTRLARDHDVTLLTWASPSGVDELAQAPLTRVVGLHRRPAERDVLGRVRRRAAFLAGSPPPYVQSYLESSQPADVNSSGFDIAVAEDEAAWLLLPPLAIPRVVHRHNVFSDTIAGLASRRDAGLPRRILARAEVPAWKRFDKRLCLEADCSIATTPEAASRLSALHPAGRYEVITCGVEPASEPIGFSEEPVAAFVGVMDYEPNIQAAEWFARQVWPLLRREVADAQLRLIGHNPGQRVRTLADIPGVTVTGSVPNVLEALQGASVAVVPLLSGSGIKNKTLEALSVGLPCVSTPVGAEGIAGNCREALVVREDSLGFAEAVRALWADPEAARRRGLEGRAAVIGSYGWSGIADSYCDVLESVVGALT